MKNKNERKYYIQSRNLHLMNILEEDYYVEIGVIDMKIFNRILNDEKIELSEFIDLELLSDGIGKITGDPIADVYYQLNYLINLRLKNSTCKFLLTAGIMKYIDDLKCEKYAPVVLIPFDFDYQHLEIIKNGDPVMNSKLIKYALNDLKETLNNEDKRFLENYQNHKISTAKDIDDICLELARIMKTTVEPMSYLTIAFVEYPDFILDKEYMSIQSSMNEMTEQMILNKYYQNIKGVLPTNTNQKYVILKASDGERFAVDGRLGSGKTYTIINIIADQIAKGKKILYVNQDLDNIFDIEKNLTYLGLGNYTYNLTKNLRDIEKPELIFDQVDASNISYNIVNEIFLLPNALQKRIHGFKINNVFEYLAIMKQKYLDISPILLETKLEYHEAACIYHQLEEIEDALKVIDLYANNIWHRLQTSHNNIMVEDIMKRTEELFHIHQELYYKLKTFIVKYDIKMPTSVSDLYKLILHIYSFASIRPLPKWKKEEVRKVVLKDLREIQALVDMNYTVNKYYEAHIMKGYKAGRMKEIFDIIVADHMVIEEDYKTQDAIFVNRLITFDNKLILLSKEIADNILRMNNVSLELSRIFNFSVLNEQTYLFFNSLSNFLSTIKFNSLIFETYRTLPAIFTKHGEEILKNYEIYQTEKNFLPKYINQMEFLTKDSIEFAFQRKNVEKAFHLFINRKAVKKDHLELKDIIGRIKRYNDAMQAIELKLNEVFNVKDFDEEFINTFIHFYQYSVSLNIVQKTYFQIFLEKLSKEKNPTNYVKKVNHLLKDFKDEGYRTTSICTTLRNYHIHIIDGNIFDKVEKLKIWNEYLKEVDALKDEIKVIFNGIASVTYDDMVSLIKIDNQYQNLLTTLNQNAERYKENLGKYYKGLDTIINEIGRTIEHYDEFIKMLNHKTILDDIFKEEQFNSLLDDTKVLDALYSKWNSSFRQFAVCFKGSQPELLTNSFETNYKLFKQFMDKTSQIQPILKINEITEEFLKYGLKNLSEGIRSCKYGKNISKQFIYSVLVENYKEAISNYPVLNQPYLELEKISQYQTFEAAYCQNNIKELIKNSNEFRKNNGYYHNIEFNNYNKLIQMMTKTVQVFFSDLDIFNGDLDLDPFDLVIIDDVHLSTSNKYGRLSKCRQVIVFGDRLFQTSVSNALMKRLGDMCTISYYRRYVLANSKFNNNWDYTNQYIYSYDNRYNIVMSDTFDDFIKDIFNRFKAHPKHIMNIIVAKEQTRRKVYTSVVNILMGSFSPEEIINILCYNIRILNALTEGNRYVNDVFMYYDDFKDLENSVKELIFKNFITAHNSVVLYFMKNRIEAENYNTKLSIQRSIGRSINNYEKNNSIIEIVKNAILKRGIKVEYSFGGFDLVIRKKSPLGIIIMGKENENMNTFIDDYQYYHNEYEKRGWQVKVIYTLDLFLSFDKVIHDIVKEDE